MVLGRHRQPHQPCRGSSALGRLPSVSQVSSVHSEGLLQSRFLNSCVFFLLDLRIPLLWKDTPNSLTPNSTLVLNQILDSSAAQWSAQTPTGSSSIFSPSSSLINSVSGYSPATLSRPRSAVLSMATVAGLEAALTGTGPGESCSAFCIVRVGDQIRETRLLCDVLPGSADLEFDDVLTL